eukprot:CAMPEP_0119516464 /NCGR_PEP_ID=MMETSP1344-20130328/33651_1 /TAXON_ID=236787 /ORGANISM="Florenciella parvula, Strain CCMP2471" /LENGTH=155 /DNA_ID=CAMNT_0007553965 /DNA_START=157 /DNA_END=626 /DNA_ORIENTATION=+
MKRRNPPPALGLLRNPGAYYSQPASQCPCSMPEGPPIRGGDRQGKKAHQIERMAVLETVLVRHQVERVHLVAQQPQAMQIAIAMLTQYVAYLNASVEVMPIARSCKYTSFPVCKFVIEEASEPRLSIELPVLELPAAMLGYRRRVVNVVLGGLIG